MPLTEHGVSTTTERDCFRYEKYQPFGLTKLMVQWDYRDAAGNLHTGVSSSLNEAKKSAGRFGYRG